MRTTGLMIATLFSLSATAQLPAFNAADQPAAPDYASEKSWAALPFRKDAADVIPSSEKWVNDSVKQADVFYIYPTVYLKGNTWNEDVTDKKLNKKVEEKPIKYQASVFNASCRVYAPRYRQAIINAFYKDDEAHTMALDFAYDDVKRAFQYYLDHYNHGRPIIIASHSQGTWHARRLLREFFDSTDLKKQLVTAYVVGYAINEDMYQNLKPCSSGDQTGCYVTWASFKTGYEPSEAQLKGNVCVNPVTWTRDTLPVDISKSMGGILLDFDKEYKNCCSTQIHNNFLWVGCSLPVIRNWNSLHIADYNLFWYDIRANVKKRVDAFMSVH